jgi:hypothetical protein
MQTEPTRVAERIKDPTAAHPGRQGDAILALVKVEARLLALTKVHTKLDAVLINNNRVRWDMTAQQAILQLDPFELSDAAFRSQIDPFGLDQSHELVCDQIAALSQT